MSSPQPPVWDGEGEDPWAPTRLETLLGITAAEAAVFAAVIAGLGLWLGDVVRRVLGTGGDRPDPLGVTSAAPEWRLIVRRIVEDTIAPQMGRMYMELLGDEVSWRRRAFVQSYLSEVVNRLTGVPDEVFQLVTRELEIGINSGDSIPQLRDRVDQVLSMTATPRWENRATVIARTETIGALNAARKDSFDIFAEDTGAELEKMWLATDDRRTRPTHNIADNQRQPLTSPFIVGGFPMMFPGDPTGPPQETIQCRCTMILLAPGENVDLSARQMRSA